MARRLVQAAPSGRDPPDHNKEGRTAMAAKAEQKTFGTPDETRTFENGKVELVHVGDSDIGRLTLEPGWRWSEHVKPIAGTDSCEAPHFQYHVSGRLAIRMDDGTEFIAGPGDITSLPKGHDAWVVGDEPVVVVDWFGASNYARRT
jgi:quercetin dioxygenase-like cupin family protein